MSAKQPLLESIRRHPIVSLWLASLLVSAAWRWVQPAAIDRLHPQQVLEVRAVEGHRLTDTPVSLAYRDLGPAADGDHPVLVLLHGSPGWHQDLLPLASSLADRSRVLVPDLPGFGRSTADVPDYSIRAHAGYVLQLLDGLGVARAHVVGFSMGSGVALELADRAPERVASLTMLSGIGAQEYELLGDYHLNHAVHALQLGALELARWLVPHFGLLDGSAVPYARNFADSDQRPLRAALGRVTAPVLILHGEADFLVPVAAAREHHRLLPQSRLEVWDTGHFLLFERGDEVRAQLAGFVDEVEHGVAPVRAQASPERRARAMAPFDPHSVPAAMGPALLVLMALLAAATLVSEDAACIGAGLLAAQGRIGFAAAALACFLGIYVGDLLLFLAGRVLGRPALEYRPLARWLTPEAVARGSAWLERRGMAVVALSRFTPGTRLPTYFAAGMLHTRTLAFAAYFFLAAALWTPALVAIAMLAGNGTLAPSGGRSIATVVVLGMALFVVLRVAPSLATHRGRRLALGRWRRLRHWEFWPLQVFYVPIIAWIVCLAVKYRSLTLPTAANPGIPGGGFAGESKIEILRALVGSPEVSLRTELVPGDAPLEQRITLAEAFLAAADLAYPVVLKPDLGERGSGVSFARDRSDLETILAATREDMLVQELAPGREFGIFYVRHPDEERGRIFSITEKVLPVLHGDGRRTIEELILDDERAVCMARRHLARFADRLAEIPAAGEVVRLVEVGTHSRGAIFLDGAWARTPALETAIDAVSRSFPGFFFGRYDVRVERVEDLLAGRGFKVVELNGLTAEATHIYDPKNSLLDAYRVLFAQWRIAFEIGRRNRARGVAPTPLEELIRLVRAARRSRAARTPVAPERSVTTTRRYRHHGLSE